MHCALKSYMYFLSFSEHRVCKLHFQLLLAFGEVWRPDVMQLKLPWSVRIHTHCERAVHEKIHYLLIDLRVCKY